MEAINTPDLSLDLWNLIFMLQQEALEKLRLHYRSVAS